MSCRDIPHQILRESKRLYGEHAPVFVEIAKGTYTLAKLDLLLEFLQREDWRPASIPDSFNPDDALNDSSSQSMRLLQVHTNELIRCANLHQLISRSMPYVMEVCPVQLRRQTVIKLASHFEEILSACLFLLRTYRKGHPADWHDPSQTSLTLDILSRFDPELKRQLLASDKFARFLIAAWCANEREKDHPFISLDVTTTDGNRVCSISDLFVQSLRDEDFSVMVFELLTHHPEARNLRARLIDATIRRCEYYAALEKKTVEDQVKAERMGSRSRDFRSHTPVAIVSGMLQQIVAVVKGLSNLPILSQEFLNSEYVDSLFKATRSWILEKSSTRGKDREGRERAVFVLFGLQRWLEDQSSLGKAQWRAVEESYLILVRSGYLRVLRELLRSVRGAFDDKPAYRNMARCAALIKRRCGMHSFHRLGTELIESLEEVCPQEDQIERLGGNAEEASEVVWYTVVTDIWALDAMDFTEQVNLCDNTKCAAGRPIVVAASRACSGCRTHVYCSQICQEEDWEMFHREECAAAREDVAARRVNGSPHYTQRLRQHHADFTVARKNFLARQSEGTPSLPFSVLEIIANEVKEHGLEDYLHMQGIEARSDRPRRPGMSAESGPSEPFAPKKHYLNRRIKALVEASRTRAEVDAGTRLYAAAYAFCDQKVTVLVKLGKVSMALGADTDCDSEDSFSIDERLDYRCLNVVTKLEKLDKNDHSV